MRIASAPQRQHRSHFLCRSPLNYRFDDTLTKKVSSIEQFIRATRQANCNALCTAPRHRHKNKNTKTKSERINE